MNRNVRRLIMLAMFVVAAVLMVYAYQNAAVGNDHTSEALQPFVLRLIPTSGSQVLVQSRVGIELKVGYDAYLDINGTTINNVVTTLDQDGLHKMLDVGLVEYQPGPDKQIRQLNPGRNDVIAYVWKRSAGPNTAVPVEWTFQAS